MGTGRYPSKNAEGVLFIDSGRLDENRTGERYLGEFLRVLRKYWEPGDNAVLIVDPTLGPSTDDLSVRDSFNGDA